MYEDLKHTRNQPIKPFKMSKQQQHLKSNDLMGWKPLGRYQMDPPCGIM